MSAHTHTARIHRVHARSSVADLRADGFTQGDDVVIVNGARTDHEQRIRGTISGARRRGGQVTSFDDAPGNATELVVDTAEQTWRVLIRRPDYIMSPAYERDVYDTAGRSSATSSDGVDDADAVTLAQASGALRSIASRVDNPADVDRLLEIADDLATIANTTKENQ